jgi:hypothetical protein
MNNENEDEKLREKIETEFLQKYKNCTISISINNNKKYLTCNFVDFFKDKIFGKDEINIAIIKSLSSYLNIFLYLFICLRVARISAILFR